MDSKTLGVLGVVVTIALLFIAVINYQEAKRMRELLAAQAQPHKCNCPSCSGGSGTTTTTNNTNTGLSSNY